MDGRGSLCLTREITWSNSYHGQAGTQLRGSVMLFLSCRHCSASLCQDRSLFLTFKAMLDAHGGRLIFWIVFGNCGPGFATFGIANVLFLTSSVTMMPQTNAEFSLKSAEYHHVFGNNHFWERSCCFQSSCAPDGAYCDLKVVTWLGHPMKSAVLSHVPFWRNFRLALKSSQFGISWSEFFSRSTICSNICDQKSRGLLHTNPLNMLGSKGLEKIEMTGNFITLFCTVFPIDFAEVQFY